VTREELALWSASVGVHLSYAVLTSFYAIYNRSWTAARTVFFVLAAGLFVFLLSGLAAQLVPAPEAWLRYAVLACGPIGGAIAACGLREFLKAEARDSFVDRGLLIVALACLAQLPLVLLPYQQALEWIALAAVVCAVVTFWLALRAWLLGDRYALPMAIACAFLSFAVMGLYGNALGVFGSSVLLQGFTAAFSAAYIVICCHTIKRRHSDYLRMRRSLSMNRDRDLLTQLWTGAALIRKVDETIARARRNRKEMAVICIEITNTPALHQEFGHNGIEQVIYGLAARVRSLSGAGALVGRYSDTSFVVLQGSVKQGSVLRTLGLRLAAGVRRPFILNPYSTSPREFRADVGVGVARVSPGREQQQIRLQESTQMGGFDSFSLAQDVLHEAAELALAARQFSSRVAVVDPYSRKTVALETAQFK
jgi:two-component system, sensor histidine kinase LadS